MSEQPVPAPGSPEAVDAGCRCPQWDNRYGQGWAGEYIMAADCPLHGERKEVGDE